MQKCAQAKSRSDTKARRKIPSQFRFYVILNHPPLGWTEGVGFVERHDIIKHLIYPPTDGDLVVMCVARQCLKLP